MERSATILALWETDREDLQFLSLNILFLAIPLSEEHHMHRNDVYLFVSGKETICI